MCCFCFVFVGVCRSSRGTENNEHFLLIFFEKNSTTEYGTVLGNILIECQLSRATLGSTSTTINKCMHVTKKFAAICLHNELYFTCVAFSTMTVLFWLRYYIRYTAH